MVRGWTYAVSLGVHALLLLGVALVPDPPRISATSVDPIEIAVIELPAPDPAPVAPEPVTSVTAPVPAPPPPVPASDARTAPTSAPDRRAAAVASVSEPGRALPEAAPPAAPASEPEPRALPNLGLPSLRDTVRSFSAPAGPVDPLAGANPPPTIGRYEPGKPYLGERKAGGRHLYRRAAFDGHVEADGRVSFTDHPDWEGGFFADPKEGVGYRAKFDATDWVMRTFMGEDPYRYEKAKFLDETREERDAMALEARRERLRDAIGKLPTWLDRLWADGSRTISERRILLFMLWDECAEEGPEDVLDASRAARAVILGFIRKRLPAGSADAFPAAELETLNARRQSSEAFAPYTADD